MNADIITAAEAAHRKGVHLRTIHRWIKTGLLPCVRFGKNYVLNAAAVAALVPPKPGRKKKSQNGVDISAT